METVTSLVEPDRLKALASRQVMESGREIARSGVVRLTLVHPYEIAAQVSTGTALMLVTLKSGLNGLSWSCTCWESLSQPSSPCAHCIAVALAAWGKSPRNKRR